MVFEYPALPHARRHGPRGYQDYRSFKPWLRDEFTFRCVFCLMRERWYPNGHAAFSVDHLQPVAIAPQRRCDYENLLYVCLHCNACKRDIWPLLDPCRVALGAHLQVHPDGTIEALSAEGARLIAILRLDRPQLTEFRQRLLAVLSVLAGL